MQLPDNIHKEIAALCSSGDEFVRTSKLVEAKQKYIEALKLLPSNPIEWEAATWIYVAIGDVHFSLQDFEKAFRCFFNAVQCPTGLGNPFIHLRLGQIYYEKNDLDKAADELTRAYMGAGMDIFLADDPKYLDFLETRIEI